MLGLSKNNEKSKTVIHILNERICMVISHEKQGEQHVNIKEQYQFYYKILGFHVSFVEDLCLLMCLWIGVF
jgi:hypothetical protein